MNNISNKARELLESKAAGVIIGYETGPTGIIRPSFITDPAMTGRLVWNDKCIQNLAVYLTKPEVKKLGRMAVISALPVMRSILMLISEQQVTADDIIVMGVSPAGDLLEMPDLNVMQAYINKSDLENPGKDKELLSRLNKMSVDEKFRWWQNELSKCIKCYACRQACPLCYCTRCFVEVNQPQWIQVQSNAYGNMEWHILRAMHLAGRCISCGECERACPVGIPCHLLPMHLADKTFKYFNIHAGTSDKMKSVLSVFEPGDKENFIV